MIQWCSWSQFFTTFGLSQYHDIQLCQNCANWCGYNKDMEMQWSRLIVQVKNWVVDFIIKWRHGVINLFDIRLTDVFRTKQCWSVRKITQIGSDVLMTYRQSCSGLLFWPNLYIGLQENTLETKPAVETNVGGYVVGVLRVSCLV